MWPKDRKEQVGAAVEMIHDSGADSEGTQSERSRRRTKAVAVAAPVRIGAPQGGGVWRQNKYC